MPEKDTPLKPADQIAALQAENEALKAAAAKNSEREKAIAARLATGQLTREQAEAAVDQQEAILAADAGTKAKK